MSRIGHLYRRLGEAGDSTPSISAWSLLKRVVGDLAGYRLTLIVVVVSIIAFTITSLLTPYVLGLIIDEYILKGNVAGLASMTAIYLALLVGQWFSQMTRSYSIQTIGQLFLRDLRNKVFSKLQRLSYSFYTRRRIGDLISITINDTSMLNDVLVSGILSVIGDLIAVIGVIGIMLYLNPLLAGVALANLPILVLIAKVFGKKLKEAHRVTRKKIADVTTVVEETVAGIPVIKAFGREEDVANSFREVSRLTVNAYIRIAKLMGLFWPSMDFTVTLSTVLVLVYGGYLAVTGAASIGLIVAFIQYTNRLGRPITQFVNMYDSLQAALAAAERIYGILDSTEEIPEHPEAIELENVRGEIEFRNVSFSYIPGRPVLQNINLHVKPGETIALVGHTGAGKTTLANLILRFYDPDQGEILIDGIDIRRIKLKSLRRIVSYVPQETYLFPGTILDNIKLGRPDASDREVVEICRKLGIHQFIERLPHGYQTDAGEAGKKLSTGEKQLIAIARAMLRNPAIVILDEALSSIDTATEELIRRAMRELMKGRTSIIIAHRLSTARESHRIIVLENGRIVEEGSHEELMARRGKYYELYMNMLKTQAAGATSMEA